MQIHEGEPYLEIEEVAGACLVKETLIRQGIARKTTHWQGVKLPNQDQRRTWIKYSAMKTEYQTAVCKKYFDGLDPLTWHKMREMRGDIVSSWDYEMTLEERLEEACTETYKRFWKKMADKATAMETPKRDRQIKCLCRSACVLDAILAWLDEKGLKLTNKATYDVASEWIVSHSYHFEYKYLPASYRHLKEKIELMAKEDLKGWQVIDVPRKGNNHRGKFDDKIKKEMRGIVVRMMTQGAGMHDEAIIRKVRFFYDSLGEEVPSSATVRRIMTEQQVKLMVADKRYADNKRGKQRFRTSTPLERAAFAGDCWEADGTRVQLQGFEADGARRTLFIVAIRDVSSGCYVGWSYGMAENSEMYFEALRMAVTTQGHLPYELKVDGFRFNDEAKQLFKRCENLGVKFTTTSKSTGKAHAERGFGTLQGVFESENKAWLGEGIQSGDENSRPTTEYLLKVRKILNAEGWDWEKAWQDHNAIMMAYNRTAYSKYSKKFRHIDSSPLEIYVECPKPHIINVEVWDRASLFWAETEKVIQNFQVRFTKRNLGDVVFDMNSESYLEIHKKYRSVLVRYEMETLEEIMLFDPQTDKYLGTVKAFSKIQLFGPDAEYARNTEYRENAKALRKSVKKLKEETLDGSERVVDEMALSLGAMVSKEVKELAESAAQEEYLFKHAPASSSILNSSKKEKKAIHPQPVTANIYDDDVEIDAFEFAMNQM